MTASQLLAYLNAMVLGDLDSIHDKLGEARRACVALDQEALADKLLEAEQALARADLKTFRKRMETVVARLGHLR
jgi:hypothetical protein